MNNSIKTQLQQKEFNILKGRQRVLLQWATGCGKSKMAIDLINYTAGMLPFDHTYKILFVVAEKAHINNWKQEWKKWHISSKAITKIVCYNSLHKVDKEYDVIVFDEAHHMFTEKRLGIIETLKASYIYLLSATLSANKKAKAESIFGKFTTSTITLNGAIQNSYLCFQ
jgi:superfamily II DNA or RNA helicase